VWSAVPDLADEARLIVAPAPHSGVFLNVCQCGSLGTGLDNLLLRIVITLPFGTLVCIPNA